MHCADRPYALAANFTVSEESVYNGRYHTVLTSAYSHVDFGGGRGLAPPPRVHTRLRTFALSASCSISASLDLSHSWFFHSPSNCLHGTKL
jgi:hypothetical protein